MLCSHVVSLVTATVSNYSANRILLTQGSYTVMSVNICTTKLLKLLIRHQVVIHARINRKVLCLTRLCVITDSYITRLITCPIVMSIRTAHATLT
jgi:hypothetical protein